MLSAPYVQLQHCQVLSEPELKQLKEQVKCSSFGQVKAEKGEQGATGHSNFFLCVGLFAHLFLYQVGAISYAFFFHSCLVLLLLGRIIDSCCMANLYLHTCNKQLAVKSEDQRAKYGLLIFKMLTL